MFDNSLRKKKKTKTQDFQDIDHGEASFFVAVASKILLKILEQTIDNRIT